MHVEIRAVTKSFGSLTVLNSCNLGIDHGEVVTLLGPSGCGKTTLLRCIAGFYIPDDGTILVGGRDVTLVPPNKRQVGLIFQNYALFPHLSVWRNVAYGLSVRRVGRGEIERRVAKALDLVSLSDLAQRYPSQLSGGQQQRVAIARVLVLEPEVLLLDEPFNALDAKLRVAMQVELRKLVKKLGMTSIFVTHDQSEALAISDRIAVMREGELEQVAEPLAIYDLPASSYVADFIGQANMIQVHAADGRAQIAPGLALPTEAEGPVTVLVRPENMRVSVQDGHNEKTGWPGTIGFIRVLGATIEYEVDLDDGRTVRAAMLRSGNADSLSVGQPVSLSLRDPAACVVLKS